MGKTWGKDIRYAKRMGRFKKKKHKRFNRMAMNAVVHQMEDAGELDNGNFDRRWLDYQVSRCRGKVAHKDKKSAWAACRGHEKEFGVKAYPYECPICGKWHVTTHPWSGNEGGK